MHLCIYSFMYIAGLVALAAFLERFLKDTSFECGVFAMHTQPELKAVSTGGIALIGFFIRGVIVILFCCGSIPR